MLNLIPSLYQDAVIYICAAAIVFLIWFYHIAKDTDMIYFALSGVFYLLGEVCYDLISVPTKLPVDFIFFFFFYFFIFLFFRKRTERLIKNPAMQKESKAKTWLLFAIDFCIIAVLAFLIFYSFDRISLSSPLAIAPLNWEIAVNFLYPLLDFLLLGYYIYINKAYLVTERKVYFPLCIGVVLWTIGDFLAAYEGFFRADIYRIGDILQILEILYLILTLVIIKSYKTDVFYTTIDLNQDSSQFGNFNLLLNILLIIYLLIYLYGLKYHSHLTAMMDTIENMGIFILVLALVRQNVINCDASNQLKRISVDATTDPLTGLFSRKFAFTVMQSLFKSALYFKIDLSVLMIDIDHFKNFNDTYGHVSGDYVLQEIARIINESIETSKVACRYGGEEFLIVLPGIDRAGGIKISEKIRENIELYNFNKAAQYSEAKITVSIGGTTLGQSAENEVDLVKQADVALYKAKEKRNRSSWFGMD